MADFWGTSRNNQIAGSGDADTFQLAQGGDDTAQGMAGDDAFIFGPAFSGADRLDGGEGSDGLYLHGRYRDPLVLAADTLLSIERVSLAGGRFDLRLDDANAAPGARLEVFATDAMSARIDGSAETTSTLHLIGSAGGDLLIGGGGNDEIELGDGGTDRVFGGAGSDWIYAGEGFSPDDRIDGGADAPGAPETYDLFAYDIPDGETVTLSKVTNFETIMLYGDTWLDTSGLTLADRVCAKGAELYVSAGVGGTRIAFDGSAESDGRLMVTTAYGADTLIGGARADTLDASYGDDVLIGGRGGDVLSGKAGIDVYVYQSLQDSRPGRPDFIYDLEKEDAVDLSAIDADAGTAGDQAFVLVDAFSGHAGEAVLSWDGVEYSRLSLDADGDGRADMLITMAGDQTGFGRWVL